MAANTLNVLMPSVNNLTARIFVRAAGLTAQAQRDAEAARAEPLDVYRAFFLDGRDFIGGDRPSIADMRLVATLEFLHAIDYDFPTWTMEYMQRVESALGDAYTGAAADVRGFVASVKA